MTYIKICGITEKIHAFTAIEAGADFIGLVFAPSKRQVPPAIAREIISAVRKEKQSLKIAGVFVNTPPSEVNQIADFCALDWVQLSGDEPWEYCSSITRPIIKAIRINQQRPEEICAEFIENTKMLPPGKIIPLLDSQVQDQYGGTGITFDWEIAGQVAQRFPVIIAGGLNPENVATAIKAVSPWGVDVSSGVETTGVKDIAKIKAFIEAVRRVNENKG